MPSRGPFKPFLLAFAAAVCCCRALPAFGAVTISLTAPSAEEAAQAEPRISALLSAPERIVGPGTVSYRSAGWSERFDGRRRALVLAALKARWGEALRIEEGARPGGFPAGGKAGAGQPASVAQAALAVIPEALLAGLPGQGFDGMSSAGAAPAPVAAAGGALPGGSSKGFEDVAVSLIDELSVKDPALFNRIRAEETRIRSLPTRAERIAAVEAAYPRLEQSLDRSAAEGKLSPQGAANWAAFRAQAKQALADGTLFEKALFAGKAFDDKVRRLLEKGTTVLDPNRRLPETRDEYMRLSRRIHAKLGVPGNSTALTTRQIDEAFGIVGAEFGIRPEFLKYMAKTESGLRQVVPSNPAAVGIMQIEHVHTGAYSGERNVANDTITNIVYGGLLRAQTDREIAKRFAAAGLPLPSSPRVVEFMGDLAYNRGPGLLRHIARHAALQGIDVNNFAEYLGGPGGSYAILDGGRRIVITPGPGTRIDKTGKDSVLALSSEAVGRVQFSKKLAAGLGDRNGDGRVDHLDVWLTRGIKYLGDPGLHASRL